MEWRGDNRGQSVQVGAILLFATLIIALSTYQVTVVPEENSRIEFDAYQEASGDIVELRNSVLSTAAGDGVRGVTVKTGAQYPPRIFLVNSLQPRGSVETTNPGTITLGNVDGSVSQSEGVGEYVQEEGNVLDYPTKLLRFEPDYSYESSADIYVTNGFVYRDYDRPIPRASQTLIRGNTITVTTIAGNLDESGYRTSLTTVPVSAHVNTVTVTNESAGPVEITIPTRLNAANWNDTVLAGSKKYVEDVVSRGQDTVTVQLEASQNYELKVAQVEAKGANDDDEVDDPDARYLVQKTDRYATLNVDDRVKLVAESRDIFNNPRSNWPVTFDTGASNNLTLASTSGSLSGNELTVRSNADGKVAIWAEATGDVNDATVTATLGTDTSGTDAEQVTFTASEPQAGGDDSGGGFRDTDVTSIVPNAGAQTQTIEFTMDSAMDAGESIEVDLSDAQSVSPDQIDYQSGSANLVSGPTPSNIGFAQQSSTGAVLTYSPSSDLSAGQTVQLEVTGVNVGALGSQSSPYTVTFIRSDDTGSATNDFSAARGVGDPNLQSVSVDDLGSGGGQTQTLSFTPSDALESGERVSIDLSDAEAGNVDYSNAGVNSVSTGSASKNQNGGTVYVTYTAPSGGVTSGTTVDVALSDVEATGSGTYDVGFSRARGDTASTTFSVGGGGEGVAQNVEISSVQIDGNQIDIQFRNNNDQSVTFTRARLDSYTEQNPPQGNNRQAIDRVVYRSGPTLVESNPFESIGGPTLSNGGNQDVTIDPKGIKQAGPNTKIKDADAEAGDTFELTIEFDDGSTRTYSVTL